jgi:hypothetical protein
MPRTRELHHQYSAPLMHLLRTPEPLAERVSRAAFGSAPLAIQSSWIGIRFHAVHAGCPRSRQFGNRFDERPTVVPPHYPPGTSLDSSSGGWHRV